MTRLKRALDIIASGAGLLVLSPLLLLIGCAIWLDDAGPALYRQERIGRGGRPFGLWKFRTMVVGADRAGLPLTIGRDRRITRVGAWLRRTKLDELPQLLNVLQGSMSLVGPRPEVPRYVAHYDPAQRRVLDFVPGLTAAASIKYRREADLLAEVPNPERHYRDVILPDKIRIDLAYATRATVWSDVVLIFSTFLHLSADAGAEVVSERRFWVLRPERVAAAAEAPGAPGSGQQP